MPSPSAIASVIHSDLEALDEDIRCYIISILIDEFPSNLDVFVDSIGPFLEQSNDHQTLELCQSLYSQLAERDSDINTITTNKSVPVLLQTPVLLAAPMGKKESKKKEMNNDTTATCEASPFPVNFSDVASVDIIMDASLPTASNPLINKKIKVVEKIIKNI